MQVKRGGHNFRGGGVISGGGGGGGYVSFINVEFIICYGTCG